MADIKLKDREALRQSEEGTAILAAVSNETNTGIDPQGNHSWDGRGTTP